MEITLKKNYGYELVFSTENVKVEEDVEEREYSKKEDGRIDFSIPPKRDIKTDALNTFVNILDDLIYYREKEFDSSVLIERLFEKLPNNIAISLLEKLSRDFSE